MYNQIIGYHHSVTGLINGLAEFFANGINESVPCVAFLSNEHKRLLDSKLQNLGIDTESAHQFGQLAIFDSKEVLSYFTSEQQEVKPDLFNQVIGGIISDSLKSSERINVYQELDNELEQRSPINAVKVNRLWRDLGKYRKFNLYRSYQIPPPINLKNNLSIHLLTEPKFA